MTPLEFADALIKADREANLPVMSAMLGDQHRLIIAACYAYDVTNGAAHADETTAEILAWQAWQAALAAPSALSDEQIGQHASRFGRRDMLAFRVLGTSKTEMVNAHIFSPKELLAFARQLLAFASRSPDDESVIACYPALRAFMDLVYEA